MIFFSLLLTFIGMFLLYRSSAKQITKAKATQQQFLKRFKTQISISAFVCFLVALSLLCLKYGNSVGFISWWIFATPVTFMLVLLVNELKSNKK
jgi:cell division protein FtsW (lipid II flippase)